MSHANALLTPKGGLRLARCIVDDGWPLRRAAERFQVSVTTAARWAARYREQGEPVMSDRSSRPINSPRRTSMRWERRIVAIRVNHRWGPARIGYLLGIHPSTVHRVLSRFGLARLSWLDRATGRVIRRYEHHSPGDLVHVDIKKLGRIPDGGGHLSIGRAAGNRNKTGTTANRRTGYAFLHNAVDDHSRLAYTEILTVEKKETAAGFWERANAYFESCGITVKRVLTDNGSCYRSYAFKDGAGPGDQGAEVACQLLVTVGDNPDRLGNEAQFAALVGVAPIPASSGKTTRHRLSRGGDRNANRALHQVVLVRMGSCERTKDYVAKRTAEGKSKRETMRCLKRYAARVLYRQITNPQPAPSNADLCQMRTEHGLTVTTAARELGQWPSKISSLERGLVRNDALATSYCQWLTSQPRVDDDGAGARARPSPGPSALHAGARPGVACHLPKVQERS